jgi:deoxyribonuclease-2
MMRLLLLIATTFALDCLNEQGNPVDMWVAIKKPRGTSYFYYDHQTKFNTSTKSLNDTSAGSLTYTTKQLWYNNISYVIYNDQVPKRTNDNADKYGHTKGFFAFDNNENGFWLTHSIPLFPLGPKYTNQYIGLGSNAWTYAQHLLCLSVKAHTINELSNKFLLNRPQIYDSKLITDKYIFIKELIDGKYSTEKTCETALLSTKNGIPFKIFSKTTEWNNDLYAGCVTPIEKDTLWVESWIRGSAEGAVCPISDYDTLDIKFLNFDNSSYSSNKSTSNKSTSNKSTSNKSTSNKSTSNNSWSETQDHSKWAITLNKHIVCMGDINRMTTQYLRGGGTACFSDKLLHSILKNATVYINSCN